MLTETEENYLKAIYKIAEKDKSMVNTNAIAARLNTSAASVTDMLKRLGEKDMVNYQKYRGASLTDSGKRIATNLIRKHRLWEVFLSSKLKFSWEQVHDIAEQLEHIQSDELIQRLDNYLGNPKFDPHGDPIPNAEGKFTLRIQYPLSDLRESETGIVIGVRDHDTPLLQYLNSLQIRLGTEITVKKIIRYDASMEIQIGNNPAKISQKVSHSILIKKKLPRS